MSKIKRCAAVKRQYMQLYKIVVFVAGCIIIWIFTVGNQVKFIYIPVPSFTHDSVTRYHIQRLTNSHIGPASLPEYLLDVYPTVMAQLIAAIAQ
jgi:hypothetical protein